MGLLSNLFKSLSEGWQRVPEGQNRPLSLIYAASWSHIGQEGQGVTGGTKRSKGSSCDPSREWLWSQWAASGQQLPGSYLPKVPARNCPLRRPTSENSGFPFAQLRLSRDIRKMGWQGKVGRRVVPLSSLQLPLLPILA